MNAQEPPKTPVPYSSNTINNYYDMALSFFISNFNKDSFNDALQKSGITLDEEQQNIVDTLIKKASEEGEYPVNYKEYNKIIESSKFKLFVYIYKIVNNWIQFSEFLELAYPDRQILDLFKTLDDAFDGRINTSIIMEENKTQFSEHCNRYRIHIAQIIESQKDNSSIGVIISGAQKSLIDSFMMMYINRDHKENGQNTQVSV